MSIKLALRVETIFFSEPLQTELEWKQKTQQQNAKYNEQEKHSFIPDFKIMFVWFQSV